MTGSLSGLRALVTAGASGIGLVITQRLIEAGARCMVCDVDAAALVMLFLVGPGGRNISGQAIPVDGDQTSLG